MGKVRQFTFLLALILGLSATAQRNDKVKYKAQGSMEVLTIKGEKVQRLLDNVVFTQKNTTIYCDSSYFYRKRNAMEAFGYVRIVDDSVTITARKLYYDGNTRKAELRQKVVYTKGQSRLTTDNLDYNMDEEIGHYYNGGKLVDSTNTLTSKIGYYYAKQKYATFKTDVVLVAPNYVLKSQDLHYNTRTKVATTPGQTEIISNNSENDSTQQSTLYANGGEFRTEIDQSLFVEGKVETPNNFLEGDDLFFDQAQKYYKAIGHVKLIAKEKDIIIIGDEGYNDEANGLSKIYGNPVMKRILKTDTFYLSADTLIYIESEIDSIKRILAYNNVKVFKSNLQGLADSAAYHLSDSMIYMYHDPIMWSKNNQIEADTINILLSDSTINKMFLRKNAFMSSEDTLVNHNQIKGRNMVAHFKAGNIDEVDVNGNGEVIYYALAEGDSILMGMNRILCSNLKLRFEGRNLRNISAYVKPEARFIPPHELTPDVQRLQGFLWRGSERPSLLEVLHKSVLIQQEEPIDSKIPSVILDPEGMIPIKKELMDKKNVKKEVKGSE